MEVVGVEATNARAPSVPESSDSSFLQSIPENRTIVKWIDTIIFFIQITPEYFRNFISDLLLKIPEFRLTKKKVYVHFGKYR
ncbi:hypothetical protein LEP1GSC060_1741 [Leptospira weilii serovar Ranarum str. ICFT]|uniref:Uncharacterized protein n=1 Tax=Leptospira weilii serovar Ranarum str. ICFT TaxID=1218598 RepID=N1WLH8_9LEPT|nr:hypothetical protein LEP1GSC060_1741 [Leptospira weilii serovar Ranarum str. ICFT]